MRQFATGPKSHLLQILVTLCDTKIEVWTKVVNLLKALNWGEVLIALGQLFLLQCFLNYLVFRSGWVCWILVAYQPLGRKRQSNTKLGTFLAPSLYLWIKRLYAIRISVNTYLNRNRWELSWQSLLSSGRRWRTSFTQWTATMMEGLPLKNSWERFFFFMNYKTSSDVQASWKWSL